MQPTSVSLAGGVFDHGDPKDDGAPPYRGQVPGSPWPAALHGRVANTVALLVTGWVAVGTVLFIHHYALNILYYDQWKDAVLVHHALHGTLTLPELWAQHNENRILVPNLVVVVLGFTTRLNVVVEDYLSGLALWGSIALLVLAHRRRSPGTPWIAYCPVIVLLSSYIVVADALFGFNLSWFLVLLALSTAVYLADRPTLGWLALAGAVVAAVAGSYSSLQGLLIWPAVLVLLWLRGRGLVAIAVWIASGAVATVVFFVGFDVSQVGVEGHPGAGTVFSFALAELGNVFGASVTQEWLRPVGACLAAFAAVTLVVGLRRRRDDGAPVGVAFVVFGLLFVASTAAGRVQLGLPAALRYVPFVLTLWAGTYLVLLSWFARAALGSAPGGGRARGGP